MTALYHKVVYMKVSSDWLACDRQAQALLELLDPQRIPSHVAIIMDGNGRWANRRGLPRIAGHRAGVAPVREAVEACARLGVEALTLYAFSVENWKRPRAEVDMLWRLLRFYLRREVPELNRNGVVLRAIGRLDALPAKVRDEIAFAEDRTSGNSGMRLNLAINYSGRAEMVDAVNNAIREARLNGTLDSLQIDEETIHANLYTADLPDPDLLIRTSGEMRISNFLLWQVAYAELYVTDTLWPEFNRTELLRAVLEFQKRERRFGGLGKPVISQLPQLAEIQQQNKWIEETAVSSQ
jgi:undecaprenyl diphosphate synthase